MGSSIVRYGIIGFGLFAERSIAGAIQSSPNSELVAIQKRSSEAVREKARALSIPYAFTSPAELAACPDVDAVFIASANSAHRDETITAARAGKHVLVEKPIAMNAPEAKAMVEECERHHVKLMVGQVVRFSPVVRRIRELVQIWKPWQNSRHESGLLLRLTTIETGLAVQSNRCWWRACL